MEIEFEFEMNDWMALQKSYLQNSKQFKRTKLMVTSVLPIVFIVMLTLDLFKGEFNITVAVILTILSFLWIAFYPKRLIKTTLKKSRKLIEEGDNSGILGQHKLVFNDNEIIHTEPESEQKIKWSGIKKLEETDEHYFLYNTAVSAIIIPKKKVLSQVEKLDEIIKNNIA